MVAPLPPTTSPVQETPLKLNPLFTSNLISLYGLDGLAATVARTDPQTGEKINKMRKSYEGQLKTFALSGKNKSVKHDESKGMGLSEMAAWPEEEWQNQKVYGKDVRSGMPEAMKAKLEKAMHMLPGPVPENEKWEDLLGIEKGKPVDANKDKGPKIGVVNKANGPQVNGNRALNTTQANNAQVPEPIRARRTTKKRRYDDGSFEGYGEGFVDDDMEIGYSSGESRSTKNSAGQRKRRKTKVSNCKFRLTNVSRIYPLTSPCKGLHEQPCRVQWQQEQQLHCRTYGDQRFLWALKFFNCCPQSISLYDGTFSSNRTISTTPERSATTTNGTLLGCTRIRIGIRCMNPSCSPLSSQQSDNEPSPAPNLFMIFACSALQSGTDTLHALYPKNHTLPQKETCTFTLPQPPIFGAKIAKGHEMYIQTCTMRTHSGSSLVTRYRSFGSLFDSE